MGNFRLLLENEKFFASTGPSLKDISDRQKHILKEKDRDKYLAFLFALRHYVKKDQKIERIHKENIIKFFIETKNHKLLRLYLKSSDWLRFETKIFALVLIKAYEEIIQFTNYSDYADNELSIIAIAHLKLNDAEQSHSVINYIADKNLKSSLLTTLAEYLYTYRGSLPSYMNKDEFNRDIAIINSAVARGDIQIAVEYIHNARNGVNVDILAIMATLICQDKSIFNSVQIKEYLQNLNALRTMPPVVATCELIRYYMRGSNKLKSLKEHIQRRFDQLAYDQLGKTQRTFVEAYMRTIHSNKETFPTNRSDPPIHYISNSHWIASEHNRVKLNGTVHTVTPNFIIGIKAWHLATDAPSVQKAMFERHAKSTKHYPTLVAIGEIDCRLDEGIINAATANNVPTYDVVKSTVTGYVKFVKALKHENIIVQNVHKPLYDENYRHSQNLLRLKVIKQFNEILKIECERENLNYFDIFALVVGNDFADPATHDDQYHLSASVFDDLDIDIKN